MMEGTKYGKYFVTQCVKPRPEKWGAVASGAFHMSQVKELFPESNLTGSGHYFFQPHVMVKDTHIHDFDEYLFFLGTNFADLNDFDAEVELYMGQEGELYLITKPTIVYVPAKLVHCPLKFVKLNKPVFFFHVRDHSNEGKQS
jgi:hypothetical protein